MKLRFCNAEETTLLEEEWNNSDKQIRRGCSDNGNSEKWQKYYVNCKGNAKWSEMLFRRTKTNERKRTTEKNLE